MNTADSNGTDIHIHQIIECLCMRPLLSSDERVWSTSVSTSRPVLSEEQSSSLKELTLIYWERYVFLPFCMLSSRPDLSRFGFGIGWVGWEILLVGQILLLVVEQLPPLVVEQFPNQILSSIRASMRALAEVDVT